MGMKSRGLVRIAVAAGAAFIAVLATAAPAQAGKPFDGPEIAFPSFEPGEPRVFFEQKGCERIPGHAKVGTDGWEFSQPARGAQEVGYVFIFIVDKGPGNPPGVEVLGISADGVTGFDVPPEAIQALLG